MRPHGFCNNAEVGAGTEVFPKGFTDIYSAECTSSRAVGPSFPYVSGTFPQGKSHLLLGVEKLIRRQQVELISWLDCWLPTPLTCPTEQFPIEVPLVPPQPQWSSTAMPYSVSCIAVETGQIVAETTWKERNSSCTVSTSPASPVEQLPIEAPLAPPQPQLSSAAKLYSMGTIAMEVGKTASELKSSKSMAPCTVSKVLEKKTRKKKTRASDFFLGEAHQEVKENQSLLQQITRGSMYEFFSGCLIITNAVFIGWETQFMAERARGDAMQGIALRRNAPRFFTFIGIVFQLSFAIELFLRWTAEGFREFFHVSDRSWNVLDVAVVFFGMVDMGFELLIGGIGESMSQNMAVVRLLRVIRIVRVAKVIRVMKFFRELRIMVYSLLSSLKLVLWVMVVLGVMIFLFAVLFTTATTLTLDTAAMWASPTYSSLVQNFGTLDKSLLSLYMSMSGGNDWAVYYEALLPMDVQYRLVFLLFITFALFAVANIVMGVFVDCAVQSNHRDREFLVNEELEAKKTYLESMRAIFEEMDADGTGCISLQEFESKLNDERVIAYFNALKLDVSDARTLFGLLDHDQSDEISIHEFLTGCYKLQGESRSLDLKIMQCEVRFLKELFLELQGMVKQVRDHVVGPVIIINGGEEKPPS